MIIKDLFTEKDGVSFCPVRAAFNVGFIAIIGFTLNDIAFGAHFIEHAKDWISGVADYLGFGGAAVAGKNLTEKSDGN